MGIKWRKILNEHWNEEVGNVNMLKQILSYRLSYIEFMQYIAMDDRKINLNQSSISWYVRKGNAFWAKFSTRYFTIAGCYRHMTDK